MWIGYCNFSGNPAGETQSTPKTPLPPSHFGRFGASWTNWASPPTETPTLVQVTPGVVVSAPVALQSGGGVTWLVS